MAFIYKSKLTKEDYILLQKLYGKIGKGTMGI